MWFILVAAACVPAEGDASLTGGVVDPPGPTNGGGGTNPPTGGTGGGGTTPGPSGAGGTGGTTLPVAPTLSVPAAFDPLGAPLSMVGESGASWEIRDAAGAVLASGDFDGSGVATWDGRVEGLPVVTGPYMVSSERDGVSTELTTVAVRPGVAAATWSGDGIDVIQEPLFWPATPALQDLFLPFTAIDALDDGLTTTAFPAVTSDLRAAPDVGEASPVAFAWDDVPTLSLTPADVSGLGDPGFDGFGIEVQVEGGTVVSGSPLQSGVPVVVTWSAATALGVEDGEVTVRYLLDGVELSQQAIPYRIYRLLGNVTFGWEGAKYHVWPEAAEPALMELADVAPEHAAVTNALTEWVFRDLGLTYDTDFGASRYSEYDGFDWDEPVFYLGDFLARADGNVINCSDAGNILATYANMLGAELHHIVILEDFDLNYILAIGNDEWTHCPFGPGGCGFSYHAVTTNDGALTVWDATLAVDGDEDPWLAPYVETLVQSMDGTEYLDRLVARGDAVYDSESRVQIQ